MIYLFFACLPKNASHSIPTPSWALSSPQTDGNKVCATAHYKFAGNLNLARSTAEARARDELRYPIAEFLLPYSQLVETELTDTHNLVTVNPEEKSSVLKLPYQSTIEVVEFLPSQQNPEVLWTKVCVDLNAEKLTTSFNQVWLNITLSTSYVIT